MESNLNLILNKIIQHDYHKFYKNGDGMIFHKKIKYLNQINIKNHDICPICLNTITNKTITYCGHFFCFNCINSYLNIYNNKCPVCKTKLTKRKIFKLKKCQKPNNHKIN